PEGGGGEIRSHSGEPAMVPFIAAHCSGQETRPETRGKVRKSTLITYYLLLCPWSSISLPFIENHGEKGLYFPCPVTSMTSTETREHVYPSQQLGIANLKEVIL
ncbi:MAG: hypothetical protein ACYDBB_23650, partial [Armatimonadota bacterium]